MMYKYLGKTGVQVSSLGFGTMTFGGETDEAMAEALYRKCREAGINLFDCANFYNEGRAEVLLGRFIRDERDKVLITSKVYFPISKDINGGGLSRRHIRLAIEQSLERLQTDYIDIYFLHHFDDATPLEESLRAIEDLVRAGKVLHLGCSNFAAWQVVKALGISALQHWTRIECIQPMYNLVKRQAEVEILPMAIAEKLAVFPYNPLGGGLLTGKYLGKQPQSTRLIANRMYSLRYSEDYIRQGTERFVAFAKERGYRPAALAIAWVASHPAVTAPLLGARHLQQLEECLQCLQIEMTPELRNALDMLTPQPPLATDRNDERSLVLR